MYLPSDQEVDFIVSIYPSGLSFGDIAIVMGVTPEYVRYLERCALRHLKRRLEAKGMGLDDLLPRECESTWERLERN